MRLRVLLAATIALLCGALTAHVAHAQFRTIPEDAKRGELRHVQDSLVEIDGDAMQLAPGAQIRDAENRIVLPVALPPRSLVKYVANAQGQLIKVWILSPVEAAQPDRTR
jgi:hypothetical protein